MKCWATLLLLFVVVTVSSAQFGVRRVAQLPAGPIGEPDGRMLPVDCDHDGLLELVFRAGAVRPRRWEAWEYRPVNRYELVFADTGVYPYPQGIATGNIVPFDVGDVDEDGCTDVVGDNREMIGDSMYNVLVVMESPDTHTYPDSLVWSYRYAYAQGGNSRSFIAPDVDQDGKREIFLLGGGGWIGLGIWEPAVDSQFDLVWNSRDVPSLSGLVFGDFDRDGLREFAGGWSKAAVFENVLPGQDTYALVYCDTTGLVNGTEVFSSEDIDQDGWAEFFISFYRPWTDTFTLLMWEATGNNTFERTLVDERRMVVGHGDGRSRCGDLDGDGVDELVWALPLGFFVYKAVGNNRFEKVWEWWDDHGTSQCVITNIADMNGNGYNDLVYGGSGKTSVFEVEAVRVLHPDTGLEFVRGDTCWIRWDTFTPPRCDSVSLFFLTDTIVPQGAWFWNLDTIATGLPPGDTTYPWVVPDTTLDAAWIVAIAYGPGWQYDRSDEPFSIRPSGVADPGKTGTLGAPSEPTMVPGFLELPGVTDAELLDICGRRVMELQPGENDISRLSPGVYFVHPKAEGGRLKAEQDTATYKIVIQR